MEPVAVGVPMWGRVGGGFDVWLPLYVSLSLLLVLWIGGWRITARRALFAVAAGMTWSWYVNRVGVIPAAATVFVVAVVAAHVARRRAAG